MAATLRHHHSYYNHAPAPRMVHRCSNVTRTPRPTNTAKRKSAVELLQETKAFYVKSEVVRDRKQEFHPALRPSRSPDHYFPILAPKSPRSYQHGIQLQDRLRMLLDVDQKDGFDHRSYHADNDCKSVFGSFGRDTKRDCVYIQHKSLPDLHSTPPHSSTDSSESSYGLDNRSRSAYSSNTHKSQPEFGSLRLSKYSDIRRSDHGNNDAFIHSQDPRIYGSLRVTKSGEFISPRDVYTGTNPSYYWRRYSNTSSGNRSQQNSSGKHSQSADSGRLSQGGSLGLRTGRSGLPEPNSPPPQDTTSDSGAEEGSPPHYSNENCYNDKRRPILRSKSDISHRYCGVRPVLTLPPPVMTPGQLELFFDHLGMDPANFREVCMSRSGASSPIFFSSVSSIDSCLEFPHWSAPSEPEKLTEVPSVVERNARIIKWLCNCRKAQMTELTLV